ncbi:polysaccharide biosynthesis tyrosine autokinase [Spongisporangium articulatum]|uniref:non-specific protein-tyrosine kinase n=1 Tax=Spongisporangium articulatum TaxID=3362603 RepID=A0ABW8ANA4_9ACTN
MGAGGSYWRTFTRQWPLIVLMLVLCEAGVAAYSLLVTPSYSTEVRLFVAARSQSPQDLQAGAQFAQQRVASYAELVDAPPVLKAVIDQLHLDLTTDELAKKISAASSQTTVNLVVTVTDSDPEEAAEIGNAFAPIFARYVAGIEDATERTAGNQTPGSPIKVSITKAAEVPAKPDSPNIPLNLGLGLFVGLGLGLVGAVVRDQVNTVLQGVDDVRGVTGSVPLGIVPFDRSARRDPVITGVNDSGRAEAYRALRTNLQFASVDNPPGVIVVTSALPGEGKSTTVTNLALTLALGGAKVVLVDGDMREPKVSEYLGLNKAAGLSSLLVGRYGLRDVLIRYRTDNLAVLPVGPLPPNPSELLASTQIEKLLRRLGDYYDYVLIDAPPLLAVSDAAALAAIADGALVVVQHRRTKRDELRRAVRALETVNARVLGTVLTFAPPTKRQVGYRTVTLDGDDGAYPPLGDLPASVDLPEDEETR